jgi:hypothetical protein
MQFIQAHFVALLQNYMALLRPNAELQRCAAGRRKLMMLPDRKLHDNETARSEAEAGANEPFCETYWRLMTVTDLEPHGHETTRSNKAFWMTYWL